MPFSPTLIFHRVWHLVVFKEFLAEMVAKGINTTELGPVSAVVIYLIFLMLFEVGIGTHFTDGETEA